MTTSTFDWKGLIASDPRYAAEDEVGQRLRDGVPGDDWKTAVLAAEFRDDQLRESSKEAETRVGLLPGVAAGLKLIGGAIFGVKVKGEASPVQDLVIGPAECALVVRDGQILGTFSQTRVTHGEGFLSWLKALVGAVPNYRLLLVDAAPFEVRLGFNERGTTTLLQTKDDQVISGHLTAQMQFDVENLENVLGLMKGRSLLHREHVARQIREVMFARVLVPLVREHLAQDIRANVGLQDKIRGESQRAIEDMYRAQGLLLRNLVVSWEATAAEREAIEDTAADRAADRQKKDLERTHSLEALEQELAGKQARLTEMQALLHEREVAQAQATTELDKAKAEAEVSAVRRDVQTLEAEHGLLIRAKREELERKHLAEISEIRSKEAVHGEIARAEAYAGLTPEQILAISAANSPGAAQALTEKFKAEAAASTKSLEKMEEMVQRQGEVAHDMAKSYGDQMAGVARAASGGEKPTGTCPKCGAGVLAGWQRCVSCGTKLGDTA